MKKLLTIAFIGSVFMGYAQRDVTGDKFADRAYVGLGLSGLNFGSDPFTGRFFTIGGSGQLGYMITNSLSTGVGLEYTYTTYSDQDLKHHVYGGYPFVRMNVIKGFFVQTDYNIVTIKIQGQGMEAKRSFERFFAGAGYSSQAGANSYFNILVSYDFLFTNTSPFSSPLSIRMYFTMGLQR